MPPGHVATADARRRRRARRPRPARPVTPGRATGRRPSARRSRRPARWLGAGRPVRRAEPLLVIAADDLDVAEVVRRVVGKVGGAVGAAVVDDEDVGVGRHLPHRPDQCLDVVGLVVGGHHHRDTHDRPGYRDRSAGAALAGRLPPWPNPMSDRCRRCRRLPHGPPRSPRSSVAGLAGGLIGYALVDIQCDGDCALPLGHRRVRRRGRGRRRHEHRRRAGAARRRRVARDRAARTVDQR